MSIEFAFFILLWAALTYMERKDRRDGRTRYH